MFEEFIPAYLIFSYHVYGGQMYYMQIRTTDIKRCYHPLHDNI